MRKKELIRKLEEVQKELKELKDEKLSERLQPLYPVFVPVQIVEQDDYYDPCRNCPNNPANNPFASGFCSCMLPYLRNPLY